MANNSDKIVVDGIVVESLRGGQFRVEVMCGDNKITVQAYISGKIRKNEISIINGDKVTVELSTFDLTKGRIVFRNR